jgi:hypothetical protein
LPGPNRVTFRPASLDISEGTFKGFFNSAIFVINQRIESPDIGFMPEDFISADKDETIDAI